MWNETWLVGKLMTDPVVLDKEEKAYLKVGVLMTHGIKGEDKTEVYDVVLGGDVWWTCKEIGENRHVVVTGHSRMYRHMLPDGEVRHGFRVHGRSVLWMGPPIGAALGLFRMSVAGRVITDPRLNKDWNGDQRTTMTVSIGYDSTMQITTRGDWTEIPKGSIVSTAGHVRSWTVEKGEAKVHGWSLAVSYIKRLWTPTDATSSEP